MKRTIQMHKIAMKAGVFLVGLTMCTAVRAAEGADADPPTPAQSSRTSQAEPLPAIDLTIKVETVIAPYRENFTWFQARAAAIPRIGRNGQPAVIMTLQKLLPTYSDHYSGSSVMRTDDLGQTWTGPVAIQELDWVREPNGIDIAVADVTPGWHAPTGKLLAVGAQVRYNHQGHQISDITRAHQTAYSVYDPKSGSWSPWARIQMPPDDKFNFARSACAQWLVQPDGTVLLPFYFGPSKKQPFSTTIVQCSFDGRQLKYIKRGNELKLNVVRGLCEPSIARFQGRYYLTMRNDKKGYVSVSDDGLHYRPAKPWVFEDGSDLGSYNTQQHWLAHGRGLFLIYTRRGANNDHIFRHRAPLFIARVDPQKLHVIRRTERILVPERGSALGNFGVTPINNRETWVIAAGRGKTKAVYLARVLWSP